MPRHTMSRSAPLDCTQFHASHSFLDSARGCTGMLGDEPADEDEVVVGDLAVSVAQRCSACAHGSNDAF